MRSRASCTSSEGRSPEGPIRDRQEGTMKRAGMLLAIALIVASCATTQPRGQELVSRAVQALGGADTLAGVKTLSVKGTVRQWEPEQSMVAGGEMRFACESTFAAVTDVGARATRIGWVRNFAYPAPRTFTFSEIVTPEAGVHPGLGHHRRTQRDLESTPPARSSSGLR